jgi:hypothetical protein
MVLKWIALAGIRPKIHFERIKSPTQIRIGLALGNLIPRATWRINVTSFFSVATSEVLLALTVLDHQFFRSTGRWPHKHSIEHSTALPEGTVREPTNGISIPCPGLGSHWPGIRPSVPGRKSTVRGDNSNCTNEMLVDFNGISSREDVKHCW